jgi:hypothetical protein
MQHLKLRHKIAALGVVGMTACLLALFQVLRWQGLELQQTQATQEALVPALLAVNLQRALVDHRGSAARVLGGNRLAEADRRAHQAAVDARMAVLAHRLQFTGHWPARVELDAMRADWQQLVQQIVTAACTVAHSQAAHRLLVEQTLQVIDIVSMEQAQAAPLRQALPLARQALPQGDTGPAQATAMLSAAQAQVQQAQARALSKLRAHQAMAGTGLLASAATMLGLLAWLGAALRRTQRLRVSKPVPPRPAAWQPPPSDASTSPQMNGKLLMARLRGPRPENRPPPRLDQPTESQEL